MLQVVIPSPSDLPREDDADKVSPSRLKCLEELREELSCAICLDISIRPCTTACGHNFCQACLQRALDANWRSTCPKCRAFIPSSGELTVNTTLWNTIQLLFPHARGAAAAAAAAAAGAGQQPEQQPPNSIQPSQRGLAVDDGAGQPAVSMPQDEALAAAALRAPAPQLLMPPHVDATPLEDLLAELSLAAPSSSADGSRGGSGSSQAATQPLAGGGQRQRPWMRAPVAPLRPLPAGGAASQPQGLFQASQPAAPAAQPGMIPTSQPQAGAGAAGTAAGQPRPRNPFVRTAGVPGAQRRGGGSGGSSRGRSQLGALEQPVGQSAVSELVVAAEAEEVEEVAAGNEEAVPRSPAAPQAAAPAAAAAAALGPSAAGSAAQGAGRAQRRASVSVAVPEVVDLLDDSDDITPPAQVVPLQSASAAAPPAPVRKSSRSRLAPSPPAA